ncbi:MAG: DUF1684 domain-containing protein [Phycisphaerae bacterium]|nr:DUF1684 domain-containing protein [Phycisphaerae bacterium]
MPATTPPANWIRWHDERLRKLEANDGWLTLIDLAFLEDGVWPIGRAPANRLRYEHATAERIGAFLVEGDNVNFAADLDSHGRAPAEITADGKPIDTIALTADDKGVPTVLRDGPLTITLVRRNSKLALRVKDNESPVRTTFGGIACFPFDPSLVVEAIVEEPPSGASIDVTNVRGFVEHQPLAATLRGSVRGYTFALAATAGAPGSLFVVFGDTTNGESTYGGGRFLDVDAPIAAQPVTIDFNRAYSPPCSFTEWATCPTPIASNRLPLAIEGGERYPARVLTNARSDQ